MSGMTSYQVATGLMPRSPITSMINAGAAREVITPNGYVQDLVASLHDIYKNDMKTQEQRAREAEARRETGKVPRRLE